MGSGNYVLSTNMNDLAKLSQQLKSYSEKFKYLSNDIKRLYWELDWETASKANVYGYIKRASEAAAQIYNFLNNASKVSNNIARDLSNADKYIAESLSKNIEQLRRIINSSSVSKSHIGRLNASTYNNIKTLGKVKGSSIVPMAYISGNMRSTSKSLSMKFPDVKITGYDWTKLGISPTFYTESPSNTVNFFINALIGLAESIRVFNKVYKEFRFTRYGISVITHIDDGIRYFVVTGQYSYVKKLGALSEAVGRVGGISFGPGVSKEIINRICNSESLKAAMERVRINVLRNLGVVESDRIFKQVNGYLNKYFKIKGIFTEIQDDVLKELPRFASEIHNLRATFPNALKVALKEAAKETMEFANLKTFFTGAGTELKALFTGEGKFLSRLLKSAKAVAVIGMAIDIVFDFIEDWNKGWEQLTADVIVDIGMGIASTIATTYVASLISGLVAEMMIGAAIGSFIPIPVVGTIVGAVVGIAVGLAVVFVTEVLTINGKSIKDWAKEGVKWAIDGIVDFGGNVVDAGGEFLEDAGDFLRSGWNNLFGGNNNASKQASVSVNPPATNYNNQTSNLQPSSLFPSGRTEFAFGNGICVSV